jgi:hypothetical protein
MKLIAHRGNLHGPDNRENQPDYVESALKEGFDAEVDVWYFRGEWWLGHDRPQWKTDLAWLCEDHLWCHCKNLDALFRLTPLAHCFWHASDRYALTSRGVVWGLSPDSENMIVCNPGLDAIPVKCAGLCSDYVGNIYRRLQC